MTEYRIRECRCFPGLQFPDVGALLCTQNKHMKALFCILLVIVAALAYQQRGYEGYMDDDDYETLGSMVNIPINQVCWRSVTSTATSTISKCPDDTDELNVDGKVSCFGE